MRIKTRLLILLLPAITFVLGLLAVISYINANNQAARLAEGEARNLALQHSGTIFDKLRQAEAAATSLASTMLEFTELEAPDRAAMSLSAKGTAASSDNFFGVWILWEPQAFDGRDAEFIGDADYGNEEGRANTYWLRDEGELIYDPSENYDIESYYYIPKRLGHMLTIPPYRDLDTPDKVLMTSITVPIMKQGKALGVVGIDIELDFIQGLIESIKLG